MTTMYWKLIGGGVLALLVGAFVASWLARGREIDRLTDYQNTVVLATTQATVEPDRKGKRKLLDPDAVPAAIAALRRTADNAESTLASIDQAALKDKAIQRRLDEQLALILEGQDQAATGSSAAIRDLLARRPSGDATQDCKVMEQDSNAPWDGWRN
jgi:hypothetical protein